ncbi:transducin/WD40 repeat-like superfamily protein [Artemisia annua]|uniref:Transducin/WD40 repeat-like superfamily protein n=1 Tax=Artemisia annua TaxID=35608 RepID=A0A2U1KAK5_ARTAN|nr:transducin/WD40 repeat-like superfamily protein [Artemisia annua]
MTTTFNPAKTGCEKIKMLTVTDIFESKLDWVKMCQKTGYNNQFKLSPSSINIELDSFNTRETRSEAQLVNYFICFGSAHLAWLRSVETAHQDCVWACTWVPPTDTSPKTLLLTGSLDETVKLWDPQELSLVRTNTGHCLGVVSVAAHPSGKIAASASMDSFVRVFDVESNVTIATLEAPPSEVWHMQFDPRLVLVALDNACSNRLVIKNVRR